MMRWMTSRSDASSPPYIATARAARARIASLSPRAAAAPTSAARVAAVGRSVATVDRGAGIRLLGQRHARGEHEVERPVEDRQVRFARDHHRSQRAANQLAIEQIEQHQRPSGVDQVAGRDLDPGSAQHGRQARHVIDHRAADLG